MILDKYFRSPLFWDYTLGLLVCFLLWFLKRKGLLLFPNDSTLVSTTTDLSTIALTIAGFILTLLTVLITFKGSTQSKGDNKEVKVFDAFFETGLYYITVKHLSNGIKSLTFIAFIGYSLKLIVQGNYISSMLYFNVLGLIIVVLTIWRSLLILSKIVALQKED